MPHLEEGGEPEVMADDAQDLRVPQRGIEPRARGGRKLLLGSGKGESASVAIQTGKSGCGHALIKPAAVPAEAVQPAAIAGCQGEGKLLRSALSDQRTTGMDALHAMADRLCEGEQA